MKRNIDDIMKSEVTVLQSINDRKPYVMTVADFLTHLGWKFSAAIDKVRALPYHSKEQAEAKKELPVMYIAGVFPDGIVKLADCPERKAGMKWSNLMCVDIDFKDNEQYTPEQLKEMTFKLPYVAGCYTSSSGKGIYLIVPIKDGNKTKEYQIYLRKLFLQQYNITTDNNAKDISRARVLSYDTPEDIKRWTKTGDVDVWELEYIEQEYKPVEYKPVSFSKYKTDNEYKLLDDDRFCYAASDIAINKLGYVTNMNGVGNTADWLGLIATFSTLGPSGLNLAISLSQQSNGYKSISDVTQAFNRMSAKNKDSRKYFTRIFKYCKDKLGEKWIHKVKMTYESNIFK